MQQIVRSISCALAGINHALKTQLNIKIHLLASVLVTITCLYLKMPPLELAIIILTITMVLVAEMLNTALEAAVDLFSSRYHPLARVAKDVAAGAVLFTALNSLLVAYLLLWPRIKDLVR